MLPGVYKLEVSFLNVNNTAISIFFINQVFADGYVPKEVDFVVVEQHPTQLNITIQQAKVTGKVKLPSQKIQQ